MFAEQRLPDRRPRISFRKSAVLALGLVIVAAVVYIFYWYRVARRANPGPIPYIKWARQIAGPVGFATSPVLDSDGSLYLATVDGTLYSVDSSGAVRWQYRLDEFVAGGLIQDEAKNLYITTLTGVYSFTSSGQRRWSVSCPGKRMWQDDQGSTLYGDVLYAECGGEFRALRKDDGEQLWTGPPLETQTTPVVLPDMSIAFVSAGRLYATGRNGQTLWAFPAAGSGAYVPCVYEKGCVDSPIAVGEDGSLYVGSFVDRSLFALAPGGELKWAFDLGREGSRSSPVIASDGTVYTATVSGVVHALSPEGTLKWRVQLPRPITPASAAAPVVGADGTIYVLGDSELIALSSQGSVLWKVQLPGKLAARLAGSPTLDSDGTIYVATHDGIVYAIQTASHGLMRSPWPKYQHDPANSGSSAAGRILAR